MGYHPSWPEILLWIRRSERIFIKKLARNDTSWADGTGSHQYGFFIPREIAEGAFFPEHSTPDPQKPHIYNTVYQTFWPSSGESRTSNIKFYSLRNPSGPSPRPRYEWQHTGVPSDQFRALSPASLLLCGRLTQPISECSYWLMVVDSVSEESELVETYFELDVDFHFGLFDPRGATPSPTDQLIEELAEAIKQGRLSDFIRRQQLPTPQQLALAAQQQWLDEIGRTDLDPFTLDRPGDAVMKISRDIEYSLYKNAELRLRAAQVAEIVLRDNGDTLGNLVRGFSSLNAIFLSSAQSRKSRAGLSFELHVERLLRDGRIRFEAQTILGGRRPDFALPSVKDLNTQADAIIVSLKTTLRERWKQLALEKPLGKIFLATVDDRVSSEAIDEMEEHDISLVVPESLVHAGHRKETVYEGRRNVITFHEFFSNEIRSKRSSLILPMA